MKIGHRTVEHFYCFGEYIKGVRLCRRPLVDFSIHGQTSSYQWSAEATYAKGFSPSNFCLARILGD